MSILVVTSQHPGGVNQLQWMPQGWKLGLGVDTLLQMGPVKIRKHMLQQNHTIYIHLLSPFEDSLDVLPSHFVTQCLKIMGQKPMRVATIFSQLDLWLAKKSPSRVVKKIRILPEKL